MTDTNALITRLEVIAKRYALDEVKEAAGALEAQARRIAELETENAELRYFANKNEDAEKAYCARIAELEAALKPFADKSKVFHDYVDDYPIMFGAEPALRVGDLRAARAAYLGEKE